MRAPSGRTLGPERDERDADFWVLGSPSVLLRTERTADDESSFNRPPLSVFNFILLPATQEQNEYWSSPEADLLEQDGQRGMKNIHDPKNIFYVLALT